MSTLREIRWVDSCPSVLPIERKPTRVWTWISGEPTPDDVPKHLDNAFLEDFLHDWRTFERDGKIFLSYYSRVTSGENYIVLEYSG